MEILVANPRGFCAGVERAINVVDEAILKYPAKKIFVFHEIVHNQRIVQEFTQKGVQFIEDVADAEDGSILIFSAHGVAKKIESAALERKLTVIDATCPLVTKVHKEAMLYEENNKEIIIIGNRKHPEIIGTAGRLKNLCHFIEKIEDIEIILKKIKNKQEVAYVTQTTLSVDYAKQIIDKLKENLPKIEGHSLKDICYATQNRQDAVRELAKQVDLMLIIGSYNSSNSKNLNKTAIEQKIPAYLVENYKAIDIKWLHGVKRLGISSGASAPEILIEEVLQFLKKELADNRRANEEIKIEYFNFRQENVRFKLPKI